MATPERQQKIRAIVERVVERLEREWPEDAVHINEVEDLAERVGREVMRELTKEMLREQSERRQREHPNQACCPCGATARYRYCSQQELVTTHGRVSIRRPYYYCARCGEGHAPLDREWGLGPANTTPATQALVGVLAAPLPYVQVPPLLRRLGVPVALGIKSVELIAQALGTRVKAAPPDGPMPSGRPVAVAADGIMMPTREGSKETRCAVIYEPDWDALRTKEAERELRKEYLGTTESRDQLMREVCRRVLQRRPNLEEPVAAVGDGAPWIWEGFAKYLPNRIEVLDIYHVVEHLGVVAAARFGEATKDATKWVQEMKESLLTAGPEMLLISMRVWEPKDAAAGEVKRRELGYFENNRARMNYPEYLRRGLPIGSGAVEGAGKHLVGDRFKRTGMRWNLATAEPLLHLRAALLTNPDLDLRPYAGRPLAA